MRVHASVPCLLSLLAGYSAAASAPTGTFCSNQDELFSGIFDWFVLAGLAAICVVFIPLFLPAVLHHRWWWLTRPAVRWLLIALPLAAIVGCFFIVLPGLAVDETVAARYALFAYRGVDPQYVECAPINFASHNVAWGQVGIERKAAIAQTPLLGLVFLVAVALWAAVYWAVSALVRQRFGLAAGTRRAR